MFSHFQIVSFLMQWHLVRPKTRKRELSDMKFQVLYHRKDKIRNDFPKLFNGSWYRNRGRRGGRVKFVKILGAATTCSRELQKHFEKGASGGPSPQDKKKNWSDQFVELRNFLEKLLVQRFRAPFQKKGTPLHTQRLTL